MLQIQETRNIVGAIVGVTITLRTAEQPNAVTTFVPAIIAPPVSFEREELLLIDRIARDLCQAIEALPASEEATRLSTLASSISHPINRRLFPTEACVSLA